MADNGSRQNAPAATAWRRPVSAPNGPISSTKRKDAATATAPSLPPHPIPIGAAERHPTGNDEEDKAADDGQRHGQGAGRSPPSQAIGVINNRRHRAQKNAPANRSVVRGPATGRTRRLPARTRWRDNPRQRQSPGTPRRRRKMPRAAHCQELQPARTLEGGRQRQRAPFRSKRRAQLRSGVAALHAPEYNTGCRPGTRVTSSSPVRCRAMVVSRS